MFRRNKRPKKTIKKNRKSIKSVKEYEEPPTVVEPIVPAVLSKLSSPTSTSSTNTAVLMEQLGSFDELFSKLALEINGYGNLFDDDGELHDESEEWFNDSGGAHSAVITNSEKEAELLLKMSANSLVIRSVRVFKVENTGDLTDKCNKEVDLSCEYDPQGMNLKILSGNVTGLEFPISPLTDTARMGDCSQVINFDDESICIKFKTENDAHKLRLVIENIKRLHPKSVFSQRTEESSASQYFQFYGYLSQQQNMMQDYVRTSTYQKAILGNLCDFQNKIVLDVGAGSGILSFFAVQAGAKKVYAIEASNMAQYAQLLVLANNVQDRIQVIPGKIEEIELPQEVDVIISEPMGYMLYNERMLETYLHARKWLKPNGKMFPSTGDLHVAPFSDESLYLEQYNKANFWYQSAFHGVNLSALHNEAMKEYFRQPIVDTFDIRICMSKSVRHVIDFAKDKETDLYKIDIPLEFNATQTGICHGLAFWFDVEFAGTSQQLLLSTAPTSPLTHWYQVRCLLHEPIFVKQGQTMTGRATLIANKRQSYDVTIELCVAGTDTVSTNTLDLKNPYFRYTGAPTTAPPGSNTQSPSEAYWAHLDAQGARNAVNLVNGITVNGLGEVSMDISHGVVN